MKKFAVMAIAALLSLVSLPTRADNITVGGLNRSYNVIVPNNLGNNRPLLIFCHGYSQDANWMQNSEFKNETVSMEAVCDTAKFVCVFPNGIDNAWDTGGDRDINFIKAIIDKMADQYKIDRNRVYLGGFSMGGMLTYHAMNKIPDLIAAFCPVSGYPMGGATANANARPIPILHIHGTGDGTCSFSGVQPALNVWINHNGCPTTAKVKNSYNGFSGAKMHTWAPGNEGVEVKLLELADKGHWICKEPQVYTGKEIWNFCKNYSLNKTAPSVMITSPKKGIAYTYFGPAAEAVFPEYEMTAEANDPNGTIEKVEFYDGNTLVATCTEAPYTTKLTNLAAGKHVLKAVATDNDGETATATMDLALTATTSMYNFSQFFTDEASIPVGWTTFDGNEKRRGYSSGYTSGCRILHFTGDQRAFDYGLYVRNISGNAHKGYAKYGLSGTDGTLVLTPGQYVMKYKICNWNKPEYTPVDICVEKRSDGSEIASKRYTPTRNIGNAASNNFGSVVLKTFEFSVAEKDEYVLAFYAEDAAWADLVIGQLYLSKVNTPSAIGDVEAIDDNGAPQAFDMAGRRMTSDNQTWQKGFYIVGNRKIWVR